MSLALRLRDGLAAFSPGESVEGEASWTLSEPPQGVEVRLFWRTEGEGNPSLEVVQSVAFEGPGQSDRRPFAFRLPAGPWHGELRLDSGLVQHSIAGDFTFPDIGATAPAASKSSGTGYVAGVVIALLVIAGVFLVYRRRSREHEESAA